MSQDVERRRHSDSVIHVVGNQGRLGYPCVVSQYVDPAVGECSTKNEVGGTYKGWDGYTG